MLKWSQLIGYKLVLGKKSLNGKTVLMGCLKGGGKCEGQVIVTNNTL